MWPRVVEFTSLALEQVDQGRDEIQNHYEAEECGWVGHDEPEPMDEAGDLGTVVDKKIAANLHRVGAGHASPMQRHVIPAVKAGRDVVVQAPPGTGKTIAACALALDMATRKWKTHVKQHKAAGCAPLVVIVAVTKELAVQLHHSARMMTHGTETVVALLIGVSDDDLKEAGKLDSSGVGHAPGGYMTLHSRTVQRQQLLGDAGVVVGTPGALLAAQMDRDLYMGHVEVVVMDEAHELLHRQAKMLIEALLRITPDKAQRIAMTTRSADGTMTLFRNPGDVLQWRGNVHDLPYVTRHYVACGPAHAGHWRLPAAGSLRRFHPTAAPHTTVLRRTW